MLRRRSTAIATRLCAPVLLTAALALPVHATTDDGGSCPVPAGPSEADVEAGKLDAETWRAETMRELPAGHRLDPGKVAAILAAIGAEKPREKSWWERLVERLQEWAARNRSQSKEPSWLIEWLRDIPPYVVKNFFLLVLASMVIGLGVLVIVELRAAGVGRRRPAGAARMAPAGASAATASLPSLADIAALPLLEQPAALLRWAIARLIERQLLPPDASLTNGELLALLVSRAPDEVPAFRRLARAADAAVYGAIGPTEREAGELIGALQPARHSG